MQNVHLAYFKQHLQHMHWNSRSAESFLWTDAVPAVPYVMCCNSSGFEMYSTYKNTILTAETSAGGPFLVILETQ